MKKRKSPCTPLRVKAKGKETRPGYSCNALRPPARVRTREGHAANYRLAGAAADELIAILGGNAVRDRGTWSYYCYHHDIDIILDKAYELASLHRQGELMNPVTAFQRWLQRSYKEAQ